MKTITTSTTIIKELHQPSKRIEYEEYGKYILIIYPFQMIILKEHFNISSYDDFLETINKYALYIYDYKTDKCEKATFNIYDVLEAEKSKNLELCYVVNDFEKILFDVKIRPVRRFFKCSNEHMNNIEYISPEDIKKYLENITDYGEVKYDHIRFDYSMLFNPKTGKFLEIINQETSVISFVFRPFAEQWDELIERSEKEYKNQIEERNKIFKTNEIIEINNEFSLYDYAEFLSEYIPEYIINKILFRN